MYDVECSTVEMFALYFGWAQHYEKQRFCTFWFMHRDA